LTSVNTRTLTGAAAAILLAATSFAQDVQVRQQQAPARPGQSQPSRDTAKPKEGTGIIRGSVFAADANGPLRRARVRLSSPEIRVNRTATTDGEGRFEFKKLAAGRYNLNATKGSYVSLDYGQRRPFERGRPVDLGDGQVLEKVDITLPRGCVITGRVVDDLGDPIADVTISAMRLTYLEGRRKPVPFGRSASTNDAGIYRLYGLPPGDYSIGTLFSPGGGGGAMGADNEEGFVYAPTYYPGTPVASDAARITVKVGQERSGIDFTLVSSRTASISGTALNSRGMPAVGASIAIGQTVVMAGGGAMRTMSSTSMAGGSSSVQADGTFKLTGVAPGDYDITLSVPNAETGEEEAASANVSINGLDVTGISLVVVPGARASGTIVVDGGSPPPFATGNVRLYAQSPPGVATPFRIRNAGGPAIRNDWSFEIKGLDGPRTFRLTGLPAGWMLKSVTHDGRDITDTPLDFKGTEELTGLQLMVSSQITTVTGTVTNDRAEPLKEYSLVVFADDTSKWTPNSRFLASARPDQNGQFKVEKLPPGNYLAIALEYLEEGDATDPDFLGRVRDLATKFSLAEGEAKSLSLKLPKLER
jgi:hypothetical protein